MNLEKFFYSKLPNGWVKEGNLAAYLRKSIHHTHPRRQYAFLDIASVEVHPSYQGRGLFTRFLKRCEAIARIHHRGVYVENILNPKLAAFVYRQGYLPTEPRGVDTVFYKIWLDTRGGEISSFTDQELITMKQMHL